jgi:FkbM family methyltransferase
VNVLVDSAPQSHAQFGEDRLLEQIFVSQAHGHCVEVGAHDGLTGSATYVFEQRGWNCLLVEPMPAYAAEIKLRRNCRVVNCAASSRDGEATFFVAENVDEMSTLDLTPAHRRWIEAAGGRVEPITVRTRRLDDILQEAGFAKLDFITIDVEGHELEVLKGFSIHTYQPRVVIVEDNSLSPVNWPKRRSPVTSYLAECGYVHFRRTGVNEWYAHESDHELIRSGQLKQFARAKEVQLWRQRRQRLAHGIARDVGRFLPMRLKRLLRKLARKPATVS